MFDNRLKRLVRESMKIIRQYEPEQGYHLAFSGGKDSVVVYDLAKKAGVKFQAYFYVAGNEPLEVYKFIRSYYPDVKWKYSPKSFVKLVREKGFMPTMKYRYCCAYIKEGWGEGEVVLTGIRRDESPRRHDYEFVMHPKRGAKRILINPILKWSEQDVWNYIKENNLPYCKLYDEGFRRLGCAFCPFQSAALNRRAKERWPQLWQGLVKAMNDVLKRKPHPVFGTDGKAYMEWWISQMSIEEYIQLQQQLKLFDDSGDRS